MIGLLVVGVALLSGCELVDRIIDGITGGGTPGGGTPGVSGTVVKAAISYNLEANVSERLMPTYTATTAVDTITAAFEPYYAPTYHATTNTYTATWDGQTGGEYSNTYLEVRLNTAGDTIEYFYARQTQTNVWFAWTYVDEIRGYNIPYSRTEGGSRYFVVTGTNAHVTVDRLTYKRWTPAREGYSASNPNEWSITQTDVTPSIDNIVPSISNEITIRLDY